MRLVHHGGEGGGEGEDEGEAAVARAAVARAAVRAAAVRAEARARAAAARAVPARAVPARAAAARAARVCTAAEHTPRPRSAAASDLHKRVARQGQWRGRLWGASGALLAPIHRLEEMPTRKVALDPEAPVPARAATERQRHVSST